MFCPIRHLFIFDCLPLIEPAEAGALHCRNVEEDVLATALRLDEALALLRIEPSATAKIGTAAEAGPAGEKLAYHYTTEENSLVLRRYWTNVCQSCAIKPTCTTGKERRITRWEHEHILEAVQRRLDEHPEKMRQRRERSNIPSAPSRPGWEQPIF
jgi:Transposase DDE domain